MQNCCCSHRSKGDKVFEALGTLDELNAALGVAREHSISVQNGLDVVLSEIQSIIMDLGAAVATPPSSTEQKLKYSHFIDCLLFSHLEIMWWSILILH